MFKFLQKVTQTFVPQIHLKPWNDGVRRELLAKSFHSLRPLSGYQETFKLNQGASSLLMTNKSTQYTQVCGLKHVGKVHRRCKDCSMMLIAGVMHNHCKTHPRHNQKAKTKKPKSTWIVTAAMQTKVRPW